MSIKSVAKKIRARIKNIKITKSGVKIFISHAAGIIILLIFASLAVSYARGEFEIWFIDRSQDGADKIEITTRPRESSDDDWLNEPTEELDNLQGVIKPELLIPATETAEDIPDGYQGVETPEHAPDFELFSEDMIKQGFAVTDGVYEIYDEAYVNAEIRRYRDEVNRLMKEYAAALAAAETTLETGTGTGTETAEAAEPPALPDPPELPDPPVLYEYRFVRIEPEYPTPRKSRLTLYGGGSILGVEPFMDYIIIRNENLGETLCTASGKIIMENFEASGYEILKMRDDNGNTVFKKDGLYYIYYPYADEEGEIVDFYRIEFSELMGDRGVPFMYPSYYGANGANGLARDYWPYTLKTWGYRDYETGVVKYRAGKLDRLYDKSFNFSDDVGIAYQEDTGDGRKKLYFFDENGIDYFYNEYYFAPEGKITTAHLGFFYYDHGLTRVVYRDFKTEETEYIDIGYIDKDVIIDKYGRQFYIPEDYKIKTYSNGMILLEKNGSFGYMNYLGEWVANPIYTSAKPFYEGVAVVGLENNKKALIDTKSNLLLKFKYDVISECTGGIVAYYERGVGWTILNKVRRQIPVG